MKQVITYQAPGTGDYLSVCRRCERQLRDRWPTDRQGQEYCQVAEGRHRGSCDICEPVE